MVKDLVLPPQHTEMLNSSGQCGPIADFKTGRIF